MTNWPGAAGLPALAGRAGFARKSIQLPFASNASPPESDAPELLWGSVAPNNTEVGTVGDLYIQLAAPNGTKVLWEKRIGNGTATGWFRSGDGVYDPLDYGAVGDDVADDYLAVAAAALDAATAARGVLLFSRMFRCSQVVTIGSSIDVGGLGWQTGIHGDFDYQTTPDVAHECVLRNSDSANGNSNTRFHDFTIKGNWPGGPGGSTQHSHGFIWRRGTAIELLGMQVMNVGGIGVSHQGVSRLKGIGNYIHDCGRDGFTGGVLDVSPSVDNVIVNNSILDVHDDFIIANMSVDASHPGVTQPARWTIVGNVCRGGPTVTTPPDNFARGITVHGGADILIAGNQISDTNQPGVWITNDVNTLVRATHITVIGNQIRRVGFVGTDRGQTRSGIYVDGVDNLNVVGNMLYSFKEHGIHVANCTQFLIEDNDFDGSGQDVDADYFGIDLDGNAALKSDKHGRVQGNRVRTCRKAGIRIYYSDNIKVVHNDFINNGQSAAASTKDGGIYLESDSGKFIINNNYCTDDQGVKTQRCGLGVANVVGIAYLEILDNYFKGNVSNDEIFLNPAITELIYRSRSAEAVGGTGNVQLNPLKGGLKNVTLTGNTTFTNPAAANLHEGIEFEVQLVQDGTGGRTVAWGSQYKTAWSDTGNTANKRSNIRFRVYGEGGAAVIQQVGAQGPYA